LHFEMTGYQTTERATDTNSTLYVVMQPTAASANRSLDPKVELLIEPTFGEGHGCEGLRGFSISKLTIVIIVAQTVG